MKKNCIFLAVILLILTTFILVSCDNSKNSYSITYDADNGSGVTVVSTEGKSIVELLITPVKEGYDFEGWFFDTGSYKNQFTIDTIISSDITVYAKWTLQEYTVTFYGNGGILVSGEMRQTISYGEQPATPVFSKEGYTLSGWDCDIADITSDIAINAVYTPNQYSITIDNDGGTGALASFTVTYMQEMPAMTAPLNEGFTFGGYYTLPDGEGVQYYNSQTEGLVLWDIADNCILYAKWYNKITFDKQGGDGGSDTAEAVYGQAMPEAVKPNLVYYTFNGYYTEPDGQGTLYYNGDMESVTDWTLAENLSLYAYWEQTVYDITFGKQGGNGGSDTVSVRNNMSMPEAEAPEKSGYEFNGYFSQPNGEGTMYYDNEMLSSSVWNNDYSATLYAAWIMIDATPGLIYALTQDQNSYEITGYNGQLTEITIPVMYQGIAVVAVADKAFYGNYKIETIEMPVSVESIGDSAFYNCIKLMYIELPDNLQNIGKQAFYGCISLDNIIIPDSLTVLPEGLFMKCSTLQNIEFGSGIINIEDNVFADCVGITAISLPEGTVSIGASAFANCIYLDNVVLSSELLYIGASAFYNCLALETIGIPQKLLYIGEEAFSLSGIYNVNIPQSVIFIGQRAFYSENIHNAVINREQPCTIGIEVFEENTYIFVPENCTDSYENFNGWKDFMNIYAITDIDTNGFLIEDEMLITYTGDAQIITVPCGISAISDNSFKGVRGKIIFEQNSVLTTVSLAAFAFYKGTDIELPSSVLTISGQAFDSASNLETIILPSSISDTESLIFAKNTKLQTIYLYAIAPPAADGDYNYSSIDLYVPQQSVTDYKNHPFWQRFNVLAIPA